MPGIDLKGKVVLISGAGKGAGRALAEAFAKRGARVAANDISPVNVEPVAERIRAQGGMAKTYIEDVAKKLGVQALVSSVYEDFRSIDVLAHCASVRPQYPVLDMDEWDWHRTLDVNLTGAFLLTQIAGRVMRAQGGGIIIHLVEAPLHLGNEAAYRASLAGLNAFAAAAARELKPHRIRVMSIARSANVVRAVFDKLQTL